MCLKQGNFSPITFPHVADGDLNKIIPDYFDTKRSKKFHEFSPNSSLEARELTTDLEDPSCFVEFKARWSTTVGSPIYSSPVIFPHGANGKKQIFINSYYHFIEMINDDGFKSWGWPISFEEASFQSSPIMYDVDGDGHTDMGVVDKNGNLYWIRIGEFGEYLEDYHIQIPKLKLKRDWFTGLDPNFVDSYVTLSMFDRQRDYPFSIEKDPNEKPKEPKAKLDDLNVAGSVSQATYPELKEDKSEPEKQGDEGSPERRRYRRRLQEVIESNSQSIDPKLKLTEQQQQVPPQEIKTEGTEKTQPNPSIDQSIEIQKEVTEAQPQQQPPPPPPVDQQQQQQQQENQGSVAQAQSEPQQRQQSVEQSPPLDAATISHQQQQQQQQQQQELQQQQQQQQNEEVQPPVEAESEVTKQQQQPPSPVVESQQQQLPVDQQQQQQQTVENQQKQKPPPPPLVEQQQEQHQQQVEENVVEKVQETLKPDQQQNTPVENLEKDESVNSKDEKEKSPSWKKWHEKFQEKKMERNQAMKETQDQIETTTKEDNVGNINEKEDVKVEEVKEKQEQILEPKVSIDKPKMREPERGVDDFIFEDDLYDFTGHHHATENPFGSEHHDNEQQSEESEEDEHRRREHHPAHQTARDHSHSPENPTEDKLGTENLEDVEDLEPLLSGDEPQEEYGPPMDYGYGEHGVHRGFDDMGGSYYYSRMRHGAYGMTGGPVNESDFILVDAHVLTSPTLVDINQDGHMELVFSVSYYFDKVEYGPRVASGELDFDPDMYVAGGIACWDLDEQEWTWMVHLDLTTTKSKFQAMIYSTPTVVDLNGDGRYEVIVGTSLGLLYVLDGDSGFVRRFFPMQFHSIEAQVAVGDLLGGSDLEIIVADMGGTVAVVNLDGDILWDVQLSGTLPFTPTLGDVDGDGQLDVVVVAVTESKGCHIWALHGDSGTPLDGYPISLPDQAAVSSPVLLADLHTDTAAARFDLPLSHENTTSTVSVSDIGEDIKHAFSAAAQSDAKGSMEQLAMAGGKLRNRAAESALATEEAYMKYFGVGGPVSNSLHLIVSSFDGNVYVIDGKPEGLILEQQPHKKVRHDMLSHSHGDTSMADEAVKASAKTNRCAQRIDIGEHLYSMPLLDDVSGDGYLDLLVGSLNGQLLLFETSVPYHPLNSWGSFPNHRVNGFTHGQVGISVPFEEKERFRQMDLKGSRNLSIVFEIWDSRYFKTSGDKKEEGSFQYEVSITRGTNRLEPLWTQTYSTPGRHVAYVPVSPPERTVLVVSMVNKHGQYFEDTIYVALSTRFYVWIKYMVVGPMVILCSTLLLRFSKMFTSNLA